MKLTPITKLIGSFTVSVASKLTFFFIELFCIPTIKRKKKQELIVNVKNNFFNEKNISISELLHFTTNYKGCFR